MTQAERIHAHLKRGWTGMRVLNRISFRYGARIFELRQTGVVIEKEHRKNGMWYYRVKPKVSLSGGEVARIAKRFDSDSQFDDQEGCKVAAH